ncbi:ephrin-A2-like [Heptranchias perlo]|uniref:ephrin-A2-like n=1 Tax=Heptranchias perlo TaxID=212740 RepID=UPI00355A0C2E
MSFEFFLQRVLWICVLQQVGEISAVRHVVYWNSTNPRFRGNNYTVQVEINDYLDILCPHYTAATPVEETESFQLYMVDDEGFTNCNIKSKAFKRWQCNQPFAPYTPVRFSEKIQLFTPFSLGFEFRPGAEYYYISVPHENKKDRCLRLRVSVCCATTLRPTTETPRSQARERIQQDTSKTKGRGSASQLMPGAHCYVLGLLSTLCLLWIQGTWNV